jgi:hypothetical protein
MASKKKVATPEFRIIIELSRRSTHEVKKLLKQLEAGAISKAELNTGLTKVEAPIKQMLDYIDAILDDVSKLKRAQAGKIATKALEADLVEVGKRLKLMYNHWNDF